MLLRLNVLLLLAVLASALYLVNTQYQSRRLFSQLDRANAQSRVLDSELQRLQVEKRAHSSSARVQRQAQEMGMLILTPALTHYVRDDRSLAE